MKLMESFKKVGFLTLAVSALTIPSPADSQVIDSLQRSDEVGSFGGPNAGISDGPVAWTRPTTTTCLNPNGVCDEGEDWYTCPEDCLPCPPKNLKPGDLDPTFDGDGLVTTSLFPDEHAAAYDVDLDSQGRIIAFGWTLNPEILSNKNFALIRYLPDGSLDASFGTGGKVSTDFFGFDDYPSALAIDSQDRIVVVGRTDQGRTSFGAMIIARYRVNGSLDPSFGDNGKVTIDYEKESVNDFASAVIINSLGQIIVAGTANVRTDSDISLVRLLEDGNLDPTFGDGGRVLTPLRANIQDATLDPMGRILVVGGEIGGPDVFTARYLPNGILDESFGTGGYVRTDFGESAWGNAVAVEPSTGKIVIAGEMVGFVGNIILARFDENGTLDPTFGQGGKVITSNITFMDQGKDMVLDWEGRVVVAGVAFFPFEEGNSNIVVLRYLQDGTLDSSFGGDGIVITDVLGGPDHARGVALQCDGNIVVAGDAGEPTYSMGKFALARYVGGATAPLGNCPVFNNPRLRCE